MKIYLFSFLALSVQSSGGDSWTKQVSYTGSEPNSEVRIVMHCSLKPNIFRFTNQLWQ